jgi:hypothetical protein
MLNSSATTVFNTSSSEETLYTYTVPASQLVSDKDQLVANITGQAGAAGGTRQVKLKFGGTTIFDSGTYADATGSYFDIKCKIVRTGAATQKVIVTWRSNNAAVPYLMTYTDTTITLSSTAVFELTGQSGATTQIGFQMGDISYLPHE